MPRPRKRGNLERKTVRRKGVASPVRVTRQRVDGSSYDVWRCPYYAWTWTSRKPSTPPIIDGVPDHDALIWDHERRRRYAQGDTPEAAANEAERLAQSYEEYNEWFRSSTARLTYEDWITSNKGGSDESHIGDDELATRDDQPATPKTFSAVANEYIDGRGKYDHRGNYVPISNGYRNKIRNYLMHAQPIDTSPMADLKLPQVARWFTAYQRGQSQATAARYKKWCQAIGRYAVNAGYWKKNLFDSLPNLSLQPARLDKRVYTLAEIDALWENASTVQQRALMVLLRLGLRFGEATGLTKECLLDDNTIQIRYSQVRVRQLSGHGNYKMLPMLDRPKTRASIAKVVVPEPWMHILRESAKLSDPTLIRAWDDDPEHGARIHNFVVTNAKGSIWQESPALEAMKRTMDRAGVIFNEAEEPTRGRDTIFHSWRYTYASELMVLGASDIDLRYCMRHTDANLSKEIYAQARFEDRTLYEPYKAKIKSPHDYNQAICDLDTDRRNQVGGFAPKTEPDISPGAESCTAQRDVPLGTSRFGPTLGGTVNTDGSVTFALTPSLPTLPDNKM